MVWVLILAGLPLAGMDFRLAVTGFCIDNEVVMKKCWGVEVLGC